MVHASRPGRLVTVTRSGDQASDLLATHDRTGTHRQGRSQQRRQIKRKGTEQAVARLISGQSQGAPPAPAISSTRADVAPKSHWLTWAPLTPGEEVCMSRRGCRPEFRRKVAGSGLSRRGARSG